MIPRPHRLRALARALAGGYRSILRGAAGLLTFVAAVVLSTAAVVLPLWLLATRAPAVFTAIAVSALGAAVVLLLVAGALRSARMSGGLPAWLRTRVGPVVLRLAVALAFLGAVYGLLLLYVSRRWALAIPASAALAVLAGLWAHRRRSAPHEDGPSPADDREDGSPV